jgi:hypothetical protein
MRWSDLPVNPSPRQLRQFAGLSIMMFGGLAAWHAYQQHTTTSIVLAGLAIAIGAAGLISPAVIRPVFVGWLFVAFPIGWIVSHVLLALLFAAMIPVAVFFRLRGRDVLQLRRRADAATYWMPKAGVPDVKRYLRQF